MNFNASSGSRQPLGRKLKRVADVNAMGFNPYVQPAAFPNGADMNIPAQNFQADYINQPIPNSQTAYTAKDIPYSMDPQKPYTNIPEQQPMQQMNMGVFSQPMVQDMALQYGSQLANTGKSMMKKEIEKYVPVNRLKYYFAVDTKYVVSKLGLLLFPFTHRDWSVKYEQDGPVQPRYEINAPDLYIPTMAYVTYILVAGLVLGMQERFSPEQIGIQASSALAWCIVELLLYSCTLYVANIETSLRTLDLLAFSGYKFVGIIASILISLVANGTGYYASLAYTNLALAFYLVRTLRAKVLAETNQQAGYYGDAPAAVGSKRRLYFLLFVAITQPILAWWLSFHLIGYLIPKPPPPV